MGHIVFFYFTFITVQYGFQNKYSSFLTIYSSFIKSIYQNLYNTGIFKKSSESQKCINSQFLKPLSR